MIDSKVLDLIACPACKGDVEYDARGEKMKCVACSKEFPVKNGIPIMLYEPAAEDTEESRPE